MEVCMILLYLVNLFCAKNTQALTVFPDSKGQRVNATSSPLGNAKFSIEDSSYWSCPNAEAIFGVSCTCDLPHTVRCRGTASKPGDLTLLLSILAQKADHFGPVSLLDLAIHGIGQIPEEAFSSLPLLGLIISKASLKNLPKTSFNGLESSLSALGLPSNNFRAVPSVALGKLQQLQRLDLSENKIDILVTHAFPPLIQLKTLDLAGNGLRILQNEAFAGLPQLTYLDLSRNRLDAEQINERTFWGLYSLAELSLSSNLMKGSLTENFLKGIPFLKTLDLSHNVITGISRGALKELSLISSLDLSHNKIEVIEDHAFLNLTKLKVLDLSHNAVVAISGLSLAHLTNLEELVLADNALLTVSADLLHQLPSLVSLDLTANDISNLQPNVFDYTPLLSNLSLADNPLHCDCSVKWLWSWLRDQKEPQDSVGAVCATPKYLENANLVLLNSSEIRCSSEIAYNDYYYDYYHDYHEANDKLLGDMEVSTTKVSLQAAQWIGMSEVELVWKVDNRSIPYTCKEIVIYELKNSYINSYKIISITCDSDSFSDPRQVVVEIPAKSLKPGVKYRYCLLLIEHGVSDGERFIFGCSEPIELVDPLSTSKAKLFKVLSLTGGDVQGSLVVHTRINDEVEEPCTYTLVIISSQSVVASRELNCSEARHSFPELKNGVYTACVSPEQLSPLPVIEQSTPGDIRDHLDNLETQLKLASNVTEFLSRTFSLCTPPVVINAENGESWKPSSLVILLFTVPGLAFFVTMYVIIRKVWLGGANVLWKLDPRARKAAKYFLYTGNLETPSLSVHHLPTETTTKV